MGRLVMWLLGLLIVLAAIYVLYTTTDLRNIVPEGVVIAVILLILGLGVMGASTQMRTNGYATTETREVVRDRRPGYDPGVERRYESRRPDDDERRY